MTGTAKVFGVVIIAAMSFLAGVATVIIKQSRVPEMVTVELHNESKKDIAEIELKEAHGTTLKLPQLVAGKSRVTGFYYPGETGYSLRVVFTDNQVLEGGGSYVEPGYKVRETITNNGIKTEYRSRYEP